MTAAQLAARRDNAQLSTGPKTPEGKKRSSLNAFRHGLTGQIVIHTPEDRAAFQQHCDAIREALAPVGALETDLAQAIAEDRWRLNRAGPSKNAIFTLGLQEHSDPNAATPKSTRFRSRPHLDRPGKKPPAPHGLRTAHPPLRRKNMAELRALQAGRKAAIERAETEAACSSNSQSTKAITTIQPTISRPNLSPLGSFFRGPKSCTKSSA